MAKKKSSKRRAVRSSRRSAPFTLKKRTSSKRKSSSKMLSGWVPMSFEDHVYTGLAGASAGTINELTKPLQEQYLKNFFGEYTDEAALLLTSMAGYKLGKGGIKKFSSALYRGMIFTLGSTAGGELVSGLVNKSSATTNTSSSVLGTVIG